MKCNKTVIILKTFLGDTTNNKTLNPMINNWNNKKGKKLKEK